METVKNLEGLSSPSYEDAHDSRYGKPYAVPIKNALSQNFQAFGRIVQDFKDEDVWITTWPQQGWRPICPGTGNQGGVVTGDFIFQWEGDRLYAQNKAVKRKYITGRLPKNVSPDNHTHVLVRDLNYHPDGGQVFYPTTKEPFVLLLAPPGDDVKLEDFVAFYCDGTFGVQIKPNIWHQSVYPLSEHAVFHNKQGAVHACVLLDTVDEFGKYLKVPLKPEFDTLNSAYE